MALFKKKGEVIDLVKLGEKGVLQRSREIAKRRGEGSVSEDGVVDLTSSSGSVGGSGSSDAGGSVGGFDFLNSLAGVSSESNSESGDDNGNSYYGNQSNTNAGEVNVLKNKLEDIEYKFERLVERLAKMEEKMGL